MSSSMPQMNDFCSVNSNRFYMRLDHRTLVADENMDGNVPPAEETGELRSSDGTEDIACWFVDTNYNSASFFVCHACFAGRIEKKKGDITGPYDRLKKALKSEIDEAAWSTLYSNVSRPFDAPKTGKIAVKVINHYGDEVLKVYWINDECEHEDSK